MTLNKMIRKGWTMLLLALLIGCSSASKTRGPGNPDPIIKGDLTEDKAKRALEMKLAKQIRFLEENSEQYKKEVVKLPSRDTTYYYKYYDEFPEGAENINIIVTPSEALSPAYTANAKYRKVRYQTRYSKSQSKAAADNDFIQDEGIQNEVYEFNGETWKLRSSVFEVTKTSVYAEDRWKVSQRRIKRMEDEEPEYFVDKVRTLFGLLD